MESSLTVQKLKTCVPLFWIWPFIFILITLAVLVFKVSSGCLKNVLLFTVSHLIHFLNACTLGLFYCFRFGLLFFYYEEYQNSAYNKNIGLMCACIYGCQTVWCNFFSYTEKVLSSLDLVVGIRDENSPSIIKPPKIEKSYLIPCI